jgi:hypothetical protein
LKNNALRSGCASPQARNGSNVQVQAFLRRADIVALTDVNDGSVPLHFDLWVDTRSWQSRGGPT